MKLMIAMFEIERLVELLGKRKQIDDEISKLIGRPAIPQHIGEFIGSMIFGIQLCDSATTKGFDGRFMAGTLEEKTVNIKLYGKQEGCLDIEMGEIADFYLVLTGPKSLPVSSKGQTRPIIVSRVYLFDMRNLMINLRSRNIKIGTATSLAKSYWEQTEIYPEQKNKKLILTEDQIELLKKFEIS